ncbi:MAG: hypothetical protein JW870_17150 [Candidatus Delongbacteria bacterium]|nr:hypothetical protein [Candidatus Delongbacteria bacterium]
MNNSKPDQKLKNKYLQLLRDPNIFNIHLEDLKKMIEEFTKFEFGTYEIKISNKRIDSTILHIKIVRKKTTE